MPKRKQKPVKYTTYRKQFENMVKKGEVVKGFKFDEYVEETVKIEDYRQCYKPGFKPREELPKYWFVSKEGFLINAKGKNLTFVKPTFARRTQFTISDKPKNKYITTYGLVGLVWDSYVDPDAYTMMQMNGIDCIGSNPEKDENGKIKGKVQPHHTSTEGYLKEKTLENYILNNRPEYIEFLTNHDHSLISRLTGDTKKDLSKIIDVEYTYDDVPQEHIKVFAHKKIDTRTGQKTKIAKVLTTEEMQRMEFAIISGHLVTEQKDGKFKSQKVNGILVEAKSEEDIIACRGLSQEEQNEIKDYVELLFKQDKWLNEVDFKYKGISMNAKRAF